MNNFPISTKKASILLYTLFVTAFLIAFVAGFRQEINGLFSRIDAKEIYAQYSHFLGNTRRGITANSYNASKEGDYAIYKVTGSEKRRILVASGAEYSLNFSTYSTGGISFTSINSSAPFTYSYSWNITNTGGVVTDLESIYPISESGTLSIRSLWGYSLIDIEWMGGTLSQEKNAAYIISRSSDKSGQPIGIMHSY